MTRKQAVIELILAGAIWGFGFVAVIWAMGTVGPLWLTAIRFILATLVSLPIVLLKRPSRDQLRLDLHISCVPSLFLTATLILQTWGLKYTTATKAGFITALYIVIVPLLETYRAKRAPHPLHILAVLVGLIGMGAMTGVGVEPFNQGDLLTLGCAFTAAIHILMISDVNSKVVSTFRFNTFQSLWAAGVCLVVALGFESYGDPIWTWRALAGLASLSLGSTALAFFLQVRAQKVISASTATMLFLLEAPFASFFGVWVLGEQVTIQQFFGGALILGAALLAVYGESRLAFDKAKT